jgi:hypothetical protein
MRQAGEMDFLRVIPGGPKLALPNIRHGPTAE